MDNYELKPCPFCGCKDVIIATVPAWPSSFYELICVDCNVVLQAEDRETAYALWNRRAEPPNPPLTLEELREMDGEPVWCDLTLSNIPEHSQWGIIDIE